MTAPVDLIEDRNVVVATSAGGLVEASIDLVVGS
jgi:hypothetical protein